MPKAPTIPTVDPEHMDLDNLQEHEARWLQDRMELPAGYAQQPVIFYLPDGSVVSNDPFYFASQQAQNSDGINKMVEARAKELAAEMVRADQNNAMIGASEATGSAISGPPARREALASLVDPLAGHDPVKEESVDGSSDVEEDYRDWKNDELRAELSVRGLPVTGNKQEMIAALEANDEETE